MNRISLLSAALAVLAACGDTTTTATSQLNLDRPVDVAFACYGGMRVTGGGEADPGQTIVVTAMPTTGCEIRSAPRPSNTPTPVPEGQEDLTKSGGAPVPNAFWYGLVLQSGPGTVALARFETKPATSFVGNDVQVLDVDPLTPGNNSISIGEEPVAIVTDPTGCTAITANAGSCDLSVLDINSAVGTPRAVVNRLEVTNAAGTSIFAKPAAMVAQPQSSTIGNVCTVDDNNIAKPSGLIYVAYPNCHLVAGIDTTTGKIVTGIQFDAAGVATIVDGNVTCADECGGEPVTAGTRPVTLDLELDPRAAVASRRMVIGAANSPAITIVELDPEYKPASVSQITLEHDPARPFGVNKVSLSPTIGMGGSRGVVNDDGAPGGQSQFVYAIASDHTVRVADVLTLNQECDTQVDPRFLIGVRSVRDLACIPVGTAPPRRQGARGPGIKLPGDAVPTSVDIFKSIEIANDARLAADPNKLIGYFAMITASNGFTFVANVDDDDFDDLFKTASPLEVPMPKALPHQLRDGIGGRGTLATFSETGSDGRVVTKPSCLVQNPVADNGAVLFGPRATTAPARLGTAGNIADTKVTELPSFRQLQCVADDAKDGRAISELSFSAPELERFRVFPDLAALVSDEVWSVTYEGALSVDTSKTSVDGPPIRESQMLVDAAGVHLLDKSQPYCDAGVEPFDVVQMRGCDPTVGNSQCPTGYECFVHPESQIGGLGTCMLKDEADRLAVACKDFLTSIRRFTVQRSTTNELTLAPRRHELRTSPIDGCVDDNQCKQLADYARTLVSAEHPALDSTTMPESRLFQCVADSTRPPVATGKRCELRCDTTSDCLVGTVCQGAGAAGTKTGFCMEGVAPPQACVNGPQRYEVRSSYAFTVVGSRTGYQHSVVKGANNACVKNPTAHHLQVGRIPLKAPACDPDADPLTGFNNTTLTFEPNPCSTTVMNTDVQPNYVAGTTCVLDTNNPSSLVQRAAPGIRFRNRGMTLTMVDPTYPGDSKTGCILDRGGGLVGVPTVFPSYQLQFRQNAGFTPLVVPISPAFPVKVVRGPTNSMWVIDQGDFISTSLGVPSTRGKVFRVEPHALNAVNVVQ
ncbi:MAG: hypothetical protein KF773_32505 [Deltaproteobacteria bacterium]|nr:hypothetical protein [Deltaproteobacteria bacterium]MCW5805456.1 hypothetical protein [Deltaproteobacteria bacterium]